MTNNKYDVIVVGAGIGGLSAAAFLAKNGKKVLVIEKSKMPGGYMVNFRRGRFEFDAALHMINGCEKGELTPYLLDVCGVANRVNFIKHKYLYRSIFPDFDLRIQQNNIDAYKELLSRYFPKEIDGVCKLFKHMSDVFYGSVNIMVKANISGEFKSLILYANSTYEQMMNKFLKDEKLKAIIAQLWAYYGLPPSKLSALYYSIPWHDYYCNGGYYPVGGAQAFSNAFMESIRESGGEVLLGTVVQQIIVKNNKAVGVKSGDDNMFYSDHIVSNADPNITFNKLIGKEHLKESFTNKINEQYVSISAIQVYLGLNIDLSSITEDDFEIFINPGYNMDKQFADIILNDALHAPYVLTFYSNAYENFAPEGCSVMSIFMLAGWDLWQGLNDDEYVKKKNEVSDILIRRAEEHIPGLSKYIVKKEVATPMTMIRYTDNTKGAIYGSSQIIAQSGFRRLGPVAPIKNLYNANAWTQPGGGVVGVMIAGVNAGKKILQKNGF